MRTHTFLAGLLVAAIICLDLLIVAIAWQSPERAATIASANLLSACSGFALGQTSLAAVWLACGRQHLLLRLVAAGAVVIVASSVTTAINHGIGLRQFVAFHLILLAIVASVFATLRGLRVSPAPSNANDGRNQENLPWQYSLAQLLSWTTAVAVGLVMSLRLWDRNLDVGKVFSAVLPYAMVGAVATLGTLQRHSPLSIVLLLFAVPLIGVVPAWLDGSWAVAMWRDRFVVSCSLTLTIVSAIAVLRSGGLRMRAKATASTEPAPKLVPIAAPRGAP